MPVKASSAARRSRSKPVARRAGRKPVRRGWLVASVGGLSALGVLCFAGCTAVLAGAAAGMLASSAGSGTATVSTPTVGDSVDEAADAAGRVLARTIKETVPKSARGIPAGRPKVVVTRPAPVPIAPPAPEVVPAELEDDGAEGR